MNLLKRNSILLSCFLCLVFVVSCNKPNYEKTEAGVEISLNESKTGGTNSLRLNVLSENVIQVLASATDDFSARKSLSIIEQTGDPVDFSVVQNANTISISTSNLSAKVNTAEGTIEFFDKDQNSVLQEKKRVLDYVEAPLDKYYNIEQQFSLSENEAIYGLGQINNGVMNYRGHKELLVQTNHHAVNPFILRLTTILFMLKIMMVL